MMTNLFSTFDPSTSMNLSMNWISSMLFLLVIPKNFWLLKSRSNFIFNKMMMIMYMEFKNLIPMYKKMIMFMISIFLYILINNIMGLIPYIYTSSSQMLFSLSIALPMWMSIMLFGWINKNKMMFAHLVPTGTPTALMPFMVMIETISNLIRPGSLAVRLMANMIAGHLIMSLLGNSIIEVNMVYKLLLMMVQILLMMFETAVSIIQAYVFSTLSTLYSSEV
uniref:ATP synthase subunit a n=1 Tax=Hydrometra greeni TaxID=1492928 RepID=C5HIP1_9HEMI|nr:ATP synthase F0 subunit 6 [Hydrometra greeni]ACJ69487.1 ATP synthase F0 subunit 6 [Hydrometra greeni]